MYFCQLILYWIYDSIKRFERFFNETNPEATIMQTDRTLLTYEILSRTPFGTAVSDTYEAFKLANNDPKIGIERLIANGVFQAAYPLHDVLRNEINTTNDNNMSDQKPNEAEAVNVKKNDREVKFNFF